MSGRDDEDLTIPDFLRREPDENTLTFEKIRERNRAKEKTSGKEEDRDAADRG